MDVVTEDTLPDDAWKDSFDKLLDQRPVLRELNIIKRDVRASFNMNSSYENSYENSSRKDCDQNLQCKDASNSPSTTYSPIKSNYLDVPNNIKRKGNIQRMKSDTVSTPIKNNITSNPFKCALSPIGPWELRHFKSKDKNRKKDEVVFNATPIIEKDIGNVEFIEDIHSSIVESVTPKCQVDISPLVLVRNKWKSKQGQKQVCFASNIHDENNKRNAHPICLTLDLQPGKWRKTLNCLRRTQHSLLENETKCKTLAKEYRKGKSTGVVEKPTTTGSIAANRKSICMRPNLTRTGSRSTYSVGCNDFKRQVLQRCGQRRIINFDVAYSDDYLQNCCKIGEGAFGEVFVHSQPKVGHTDKESAEKTVLKIIPIEGKELVNGEVQKTFEQILPEIIISMELSDLSDENRKTNYTNGFVNLQRVRCVKGRYPSYLQKLWDTYDMEKESENDHPKCFPCNQQYIVLELAYSGQDLEGFNFKSAEQSFSALQQIIFTLAVGEKEYQFEHRDLHWGNVLVLNTHRPSMSYKLGDDMLTIPTKGIQITIIDYTLSRMTLNDYCFYNDLSNDEELFIATGDYQFEIYRMMREVLSNKWETFEPKTNIYWISYIISKLIEGVSYKNTRSKNHLHYLNKLKDLQTSILKYKSCVDCVRDVFLF